MRDFLECLKEHLAAGRSVVVATIVAAEGSTPRKVGAKMIIQADGTIDFTLGGGPFEALVIEDARQALLHHRSTVNAYRFLPVGENATGMTCGGDVEVFLEVHRQPERVVVFGGGHVALPLAKLAKSTGFRVAVIDDRAQFADAARFPGIDEVVHAADGYARCDFPLEADDYVVIVTRCHQTDEACLRHVLEEDVTPAYAGIVASRRKAKVLFGKLLKDGVAAERLEAIRAPIGLDIGAETPDEIAVSIVGEILAVRSQRTAAPLSRETAVPRNVTVRRTERVPRTGVRASRPSASESA
ncbi:MAG: xanthine dehydrogenase accessory factor [Gemmatimonadota bacterium]|nr:MAG: xanthine dehydrogenase accessory factor [Gemmatimonadota bacterium]